MHFKENRRMSQMSRVKNITKEAIQLLLVRLGKCHSDSVLTFGIATQGAFWVVQVTGEETGTCMHA